MKATWEKKPLGALCDVLDHKRKPITKCDRVAGQYPYYGATGIQDYTAYYLFDEPLVLVGEDGAKWGSGENTAFAVEGRYWVNNHAHVLRPYRDSVIDNWLIHYLNHSDLSNFVSGLTVQKLNQGNLREIPIPLPPLHEQKRIVTILDEAFEGIATAKANAEKNLQNAFALFESYTHTEFEELQKKYQGKPLQEVCTIEKIQGHHQELAYVGLENIEANTGIFTGDKTPKAAKSSTFKFNNEHVLYGRLRPYLNKVLVPNFFGHCSAEIFPLKPRAELKREFLSYWLMRASTVERINSTCTGARMPRANMNHVMKLMIHLPCIEVQNSIVIRFNGLKEEINKLESIYQNKLTALEELKKALLNQAFNGGL